MEQRKKKFKWWYILVAFVVIGVVGAIFGGGDKASTPSDSSTTPPASASASVAPTSESAPAPTPAPTATPAAPSTIAVDMEIGSGNYTAGIDFPAGKYDLVAVAGGGNVSSSNAFSGGVNAIMGVAEKNTNGIDMYEQEYSNIDLPLGETLSLSGVTLKITCDEADGAALTPRNQSITDAVELGNGNFVAGEDFAVGVYDISATSGGGNVSSDNAFSGGINAILGTADKNSNGMDMYEQLYRNIDLSEGVTLTVDGVKLSLTPSK